MQQTVFFEPHYHFGVIMHIFRISNRALRSKYVKTVDAMGRHPVTVMRSAVSETTDLAVKSAVVPGGADVPEKELPLYLSVRARINERIGSQETPNGSVIKEGPLAFVFGISRAPVRRALKILEEARVISAAKGQGFIVGNTIPGAVLSPGDLRTIFRDRPELTVVRKPAWENASGLMSRTASRLEPFRSMKRWHMTISR